MHNEELQDLKSSINNIQVIKPKSRLPRHVAHRGNNKMNTGVWWGNLTKKHYLEDLCVDKRIILKLVLGGCGMNSTGSG